ncbi:hypothetical protein FDC58_16620 [Clostridium botulinum]|uniref:hypothetical protein n=1 Tax=unclassified Clostridium TaxID=2614128 RepID=UPI00142C1F52|nr:MULTISPECIES: hypothetical protein [unclassified Clostridium]NFO86080.1 hypothetical protein [Clostridium botulinum]NFP30820.1 hypothetical protein [Clostridium botulinum]
MAKEKENVVDTPNELTYPIQTFIDNSKALGYDKIIVTGALFNYKETELSKTKFIKIVKEFLGKKVE